MKNTASFYSTYREKIDILAESINNSHDLGVLHFSLQLSPSDTAWALINAGVDRQLMYKRLRILSAKDIFLSGEKNFAGFDKATGKIMKICRENEILSIDYSWVGPTPVKTADLIAFDKNMHEFAKNSGAYALCHFSMKCVSEEQVNLLSQIHERVIIENERETVSVRLFQSSAFPLALSTGKQNLSNAIDTFSIENGFSSKEKEVFGLLIESHPLKVIADQIHISIHTVNKRLKSIYEKSKCDSRIALLVSFYNRNYE